MKTLKDLFLDEVADMYDAEHRIVKALPKLIKAATCPQLQTALQNHLHETEGHVKKLEKVFAAFGEKAKAKKCEATVGLLKEGDEIIADFKGSPAINAAIISAGQKVEHYEIASYTCLHLWANLLENQPAANLIAEILGQEKAANEGLAGLLPEKSQQALRDNSEDFGNENYEEKLSHRSAKLVSQPLSRTKNGKAGSTRRATVLT